MNHRLRSLVILLLVVGLAACRGDDTAEVLSLIHISEPTRPY